MMKMATDKRRDNQTDMFLVFIGMCLFIYMLLLMVGCSGPRMAVSSQHDSVRTVITDRVIYRDTVIYVPVPAESDRAVLQDTDTSILRTSLAESEAFVSGGKLHHSLRNRNELLQPISLKMPERVQHTDHSHLAARTVTVEVERELTRWQRFIQALGLGAFVAACAAILYMAVRIIRKFI